MIIKRGDRGEVVKIIQRNLNLLADGIFGPLTEEAVRTYQKENGLTVDGIVGPVTYSRLVPNFSTRRIDEIIVHCSATPEGKDFDVNNIRDWHLQRGFSDVGYHYVILRDGTIQQGRKENVIGANCTGHNSHSIGVCYIGGMDKDNKVPKDTRTPEQKESLLSLLQELKMKYPKARIHGHRDFANKACPSFDATEEYKGL